MTYSLAAHLIRDLWLITFAYWIVRAFGNKRAKFKQSILSRVIYVVGFVALFEILGFQRNVRFLLYRITPATLFAGVLLCAAGLALAIWARTILGRNWSGIITIKQDHELIQRGPYTVVRHPLYSGLILAAAGTIIALMPTSGAVMAGLLIIVAFYIKARHEEHVLLREFGEQYLAYKRKVKSAIIPFIL